MRTICKTNKSVLKSVANKLLGLSDVYSVLAVIHCLEAEPIKICSSNFLPQIMTTITNWNKYYCKNMHN